MKKENNYGELNELNLKMLIALSRTTQAVHKRSSFVFKQGGLTTAQFSVLEALYHKGPMSINQIIHTVLSTPGNMTVVINNLERDGMVSRCDHPDDNRSVLVTITEMGRSRIEEIFPVHLKDLEENFAALSPTEKTQLIGLLKKLKAPR